MFIIEPNEWKDEMEYLILFEKESKKKFKEKWLRITLTLPGKKKAKSLSYEKKRKKRWEEAIRGSCKKRRFKICSEFIFNFGFKIKKIFYGSQIYPSFMTLNFLSSDSHQGLML
jgi:hypothetical protein